MSKPCPSLTLKPIAELLDKQFYIPAYQRGSRWTARQVTDLLDDIAAFQRESEGKKKETFYCLQPVVVKRLRDERLELVDGQQRLTTLFLILQFLGDLVKVLGHSPYSLEYETRSDSAQFLENIDLSRADENIDYCHICEAYQTIAHWFEGQPGPRRLKLLQCLVNSDEEGKNVKVIWYELARDQVPVEAFVRLNIGKIPLTNSELIRALFLRSRNFDENEVGLRQLQIAQEWDGIEKAMQADDFWYFLYGGMSRYSTRIEYLFELLIDSSGTTDLMEDDHRTFIAYARRFDSNENGTSNGHLERVANAWRDVKRCYMVCEEWFKNRTLYHLAGFLISQQVDLGLILDLAHEQGKSGLQSSLRRRIFELFFDSDTDECIDRISIRQMVSEMLEELSYERDRKKIRSVLLLFNIATLLRNRGSNLRFPLGADPELAFS